jgi:DNA ligase-1
MAREDRMTNRAKKNVEIGDIKVNVCLFAFDLMYLNGEPLLNYFSL